VASDVLMPRLSDSMEEGTVLKWLVETGGEVRRGQPLVEIETDKANMTYDADADGVLVEVLAQEGDTLEVGQPIARIGSAEEAGGDGGAPAEREAPARAKASPDTSGQKQTHDVRKRPVERDGGADDGDEDGGERVKASPVARRLAEELGVELRRIDGSGPGGRIVKADVEAAAEGDGGAAAAVEAPAREAPEAPTEREPSAPAEEPKPAPPPAPAPATAGGAKGEVATQELSRLQRTISRRMAESKATIPHFSLELDVDMTLCIELRERLKSQTEHPPSFNDMVVKAAALALRDHPRVNGAYRDGRFEHYSRINVGVAVAAEDALVVPVVHDADEKSLGEISRQARRLIERVREGQVTPPEVSGGTFTVSNLGMYGIDRFTAIINPPQAAILSVGSLSKRPKVDDRGRVVARDLMSLTLACDHRILYGADGAEFLAQVRELLEQPLSLAL
jgi:pyruvate dehydrogenase E2 component (dihydrolipoamide acetyltransferase)